MEYGYARVSTKEQNIDRQLNAVLKEGIEMKQIYIDKASGNNFKRSEYQRLIKKLKEGDELYIKSIDRLGRNYDEIIKEWNFWPLVPYSALLENILYFLYPLPGNSLKTKNN